MEASPVSLFIEAKGDAAAVAGALGKKPGAVRQWKFKGVIPRKVWPDLVKAYPEVTLDELRDLEKAA